MKTVVKLCSSLFYLGYVPFMPGTAGSLGGLVLYLVVSHHLLLYICLLTVLIILAFLVINKAEEIYGERDARHIVIDEAIGMMVALFLLPVKISIILPAFVLFRSFDIVKPFPVRWAGGQSSPAGVILDDIIAGVYVNLLIQIFRILAVKSGV